MKTIEKAIALAGETEPEQYHVLAKGDTEMAQQILAVAREHGIPVVEHPALLELFANINPGDTIPDALFEAIAGVIKFAISVDNSLEAQLPDNINTE